MNNEGDIIWEKNYFNFMYQDIFKSIIKSSNNGYLACGISNLDIDAYHNKMRLLKVDENGYCADEPEELILNK